MDERVLRSALSRPLPTTTSASSVSTLIAPPAQTDVGCNHSRTTWVPAGSESPSIAWLVRTRDARVPSTEARHHG